MTIRDLIDQLREIGYKHGWDVEAVRYDDSGLSGGSFEPITALAVQVEDNPGKATDRLICVID